MMLSVLLIASTAHDAADPAHVADAANAGDPAAATYVAHNTGASHGCAAGTEATVDANDDDGTMMPRISLTKTKPTSKPLQPCKRPNVFFVALLCSDMSPTRINYAEFLMDLDVFQL